MKQNQEKNSQDQMEQGKQKSKGLTPSEQLLKAGVPKQLQDKEAGLTRTAVHKDERVSRPDDPQNEHTMHMQTIRNNAAKANPDHVLDLGRGPVHWGFINKEGHYMLRWCPKCLKENGLDGVRGFCGKCGFDIELYKTGKKKQ